MEWNWGGILVFSSGLMVVFHLRASTGGFCCPLPEGIGSPEAGLFQIKPVGKSSESRFKAVSTSGVPPFGAADVMRASAGDAGGFLRHSSGRSGASSQPIGAGLGGCGRRYHCLLWDQEARGGREVIQGGVVARSPVQNLAGARFRIPPEPGAAAWWGEISWLSDHPGGPQVFSLELSALKSQRPEPQ